MTDRYVLAQVRRKEFLLRDVARSGGTDTLDHLRSHGHHHSTIRAAFRSDELRRIRRRGHVRLTSAGWHYVYLMLRSQMP